MAYGPTIGDGSGDSKANALNINSAGAWATLSATSADWGKYSLVTADIDFLDAEIGSVGAAGTKFTGTFDGDNHTFSNATVNSVISNNSTAMFKFAGGTSLIKDLTFTNFTANGTSDNGGINSYCAIIVGETVSGSLVSNCHVINPTITHLHTVATKGYVGPIVGSNHGDITLCTVTGGTVKGDATAGLSISIGGIVGLQTGVDGTVGTTDFCSSSATLSDISGSSSVQVFVGGIAGYISFHNVTYHLVDNCTFSGEINYNSTDQLILGGIAGFVDGAATNNECIDASLTATTTDITNLCSFGGLCGTSSVELGELSGNEIECDLTVTGAKINIGGLVGILLSPLNTSKYEGTISATASANDLLIGGIAGTASTGSSVDQCKADVNLRADSPFVQAGGAFGKAKASAITNCYVNGTVYDLGASSTALTFGFWGGFVGNQEGGTMADCYTTIGPWTVGGVAGNQEGFVGIRTGTVTDCYCDSTVATHTGTLDGGEWKTTAELFIQSTYSGWDFTADPDRDWKMADGYMYAMLDWEIYEYSGGSGTENDPYKIGNAVDFAYAIQDVDNRSAAEYYINSADFVYDTYLNYIAGSGGGNRYSGGGRYNR